ncbi:MAG: MBL fold metallo-hydrolase [Geminicoccaceae bacterium]|nr:MBL fold metallo-hydrolase [Geminicoccaceae bacterium]
MRATVIPVTPLQQNCVLFHDDATRRGVVVDPGGDVARIRAAIDEAGVTLERILLTHGHIDHAGGAAELKETLGGTVPIEGPDRRDAPLLDALEEQGRQFGLASARNVRPDRWLEEGETIELAGEPFEILHCPGHAPGHLVYVSRRLRFVIMGDVLFRGSIGRTDFAYGDHDALIDAIRTKILPLGDDVQFLCGHGPGSTIGEERVSNPFIQGS